MLLASNKRPEMLYAALELRCGVEARLNEYLQPQEEAGLKLKQGWRIPVMGKAVDPGKRWGDRVFRVDVYTADAPMRSLLYTPVRARLRNLAGQMNPLLHAAKNVRDDRWWASKQALLEQVVDELSFSTKGQLLAVPVVDPKQGTVRMYMEEPFTDLQKTLTPGKMTAMHVQWLDDDGLEASE